MTLSEGIVKINSKALEASELKKFDKLEKEGIAFNGAVTKGKKKGHKIGLFWFFVKTQWFSTLVSRTKLSKIQNSQKTAKSQRLLFSTLVSRTKLSKIHNTQKTCEITSVVVFHFHLTKKVAYF